MPKYVEITSGLPVRFEIERLNRTGTSYRMLSKTYDIPYGTLSTYVKTGYLPVKHWHKIGLDIPVEKLPCVKCGQVRCGCPNKRPRRIAIPTDVDPYNEIDVGDAVDRAVNTLWNEKNFSREFIQHLYRRIGIRLAMLNGRKTHPWEVLAYMTIGKPIEEVRRMFEEDWSGGDDE